MEEKKRKNPSVKHLCNLVLLEQQATKTRYSCCNVLDVALVYTLLEQI